jgi:alpha-D-ribose 1-methylphosphonate 5-phosphate C-P lyase
MSHEPDRSVATYNFAYLDEQTKRMIRRAILKAIAIPGYQVPFASREMPMPYGWGTGGVQVTAAILGPKDVLKVIDQGADDTTNAVSIRAFFQKVANVAVTTKTREATIIQTRHRIPEEKLTAGQTLVYQVPIPEPAALPRAARDRDAQDACARRIRPDACEALRGHRQARPYRHHLRLSGQGRGPLRDGSLADAEIRQSEDAHVGGAAAFRRRPRKAHLRRAALSPRSSASISRTIPSRSRPSTSPARCAAPKCLSRRGDPRRQGRADVRLLRHRPLRERCAGGHRGHLAYNKEAAE